MSRPSALPVDFQNIPEQLKAIDRWVLWRFTLRRGPDGKEDWTKKPFTVDGQSASSTNEKTWASYDDAADTYVLGDYDGIGLVLSDDLHGIDLDNCRNPETGELLPIAQEVLEKVEGYAEVSPSGTGLKIFSNTNLDRSRTKKSAGVELYRGERYFTVTGHAINGHCALPGEVQDLGWFVQKVWGEQLTEPGVLSDDAAAIALANYREPLEGWDLDRVVDEILPHLDPDCGYEEWLKIGAAMHHQSGGDEEWLAAWDQWSAGSGKYVEGYCEDKWRSFNQKRATGAVVTLASLIKQTKPARQQAAAVERQEVVDDLILEIELTMRPQDLQEQVAARIANTGLFTDIEREQLAAEIQKRAKEMGVKLPIATVRGWVRCRTARGEDTMPQWAQPWVYVTDGDKFFNTETKQEVTPQGFRALYNRLMPLTPDGARERADAYALEMWGLPVVSHKAYMPGAGITFEMFGLQWVNLYRPESVPAIPAQFSADELDALAVVQGHFDTYLADARERDLLISWLAHNVQRPGVKVRWAPYIHGVPGDGKSFFSELVAMAMGGQNVRSLNGSTLESNFTDWAVGYALVAIEEMKQHGHNRYDIMNRLKPFITNTSVEIHPKGKASYTAPNVSNYVIFSNYLDGAPVDEGDRRYMFVSSRLTTRMAERMTGEGYFGRLFSAIQAHPGAIRKWLLEYQLHPEFDANGRAPNTDVKRTVVEMSKYDLELAAEDVIEEGAEGVTRDAISSSHLTRALVAGGAEAPTTTRLNTLLTRLGYRFAWRKKWKGEACRIWTRQDSSPDEEQAMALLNGSSSESADFLR